MRRWRPAVVAVDAQIEHVATSVVVVLGEFGACECDGHRRRSRGSLCWSSAVTTQAGSLLKSTTTRSHRPDSGKSSR